MFHPNPPIPNPQQMWVIKIDSNGCDTCGTTVGLLNLNGQLLMNQQLEDELNIINTSFLNSGVYVYRIIDDQTKLIKSGKWVKY